MPAGAGDLRVGRCKRLYTAVLADVLDRMGRRDQAMCGVAALHAGARLAGTALPVQAAPWSHPGERPYAKELEAVEALAPGDVMVVAGAGREAAFWGELLSTRARGRGAAGVVVDGMCRDTERLGAMGFPVFASGTSPRDSYGRIEVLGVGQPALCSGVWVCAGDLVLGDADGVVVIPADLADEALARAEQKVAAEDRVRSELAGGSSVQDTFARYGVM